MDNMIDIANEIERIQYFETLMEEAMEIAEIQERICKPDDCFPAD